MKKTAADIALAFIDHINSHDIPSMATLMTDDFLFVDGLGQEVRGIRQMEKGWEGYFSLFPDYSIQVDDVFSHGPIGGLFGSAQGTYAVGGKLLAENRWKIPAAWKALVRKERIAEWRVYADNEPVWKIMRVKR
ncbi:MAG TPA: nuclear transport factor 2 family protein [Silvibacterium sp.]|jgi:ketosteroid isomerase-like protein|nr:nuclear transport factor 2 family protein [Silvibacterium sp.]